MRVEQNQRFVSQVLGEVVAGRLVPAGMQRPYVWREPDVLAFCESLTEGLPTGTLLTWRPPAGLDPSDVARPWLAPVRPESVDRNVRLILDGQNRLATFAWMLGGEVPDDLSEAESATWVGRSLVIDAEAGGFILVPEDVAETGLRLSASVCAPDRTQPLLRQAFARWRREGFDEATADAFLLRISDITDRIREARTIETVIDVNQH
ncbi:DUF262 domain-containing protein [Jannaschia formosa]|uniref:DUF262 domain-containing protein n=1 Tax=Jannaschia formosa TaxID=2259592 RepID=UPI000E1C1020|nr:DUF262 domain-containing protein [Jannaschia formosa]TFL15963.1 DUF262 domain-containing protein [Jannaschia formosa]